MCKITVNTASLTNPRWPGDSLKPAETTTMQVDAPEIKPDQFIEFRIRQDEDLVETVQGKPGDTSATWKVPNLPHNPKLKFDAVLRQKASPKTGFYAVLAKATSKEAEVKGFHIESNGGDAAFVPHTEKLEVKYKIVDPGKVAAYGRYEIWGERYGSNAALHTENFNPVTSPDKWDTWDGKATLGSLANAYITPEFSPYRARIIIGPDQASIDDAFGNGIAQVAMFESTFEVVFQSVHIRLQAGITEAASALPATAQYTLAQALAIEPYAAVGTYAAMGRLPAPAEVCRIRIPMACHQRATDKLGQGGLAVTAEYMGRPISDASVNAATIDDGGSGYTPAQVGAAVTFSASPTGDTTTGTIGAVAGGAVTSITITNQGSGYTSSPKITMPPPAGAGYTASATPQLVGTTEAGKTKWTIDSDYYTRPEIPLEFELRLRSRVATNNTNPAMLGLFDVVAVGPAKIEPHAEDVYMPAIYNGTGKDQTYWRKAACKIKGGTHDAPENSGPIDVPARGLARKSPVFHCWQVRREMGNGTTDVDLDQFDAADRTYRYEPGQDELTVFLNRAKLVRGADQAALDKGWADYIEVDYHTIKLRANLTKAQDILWVIRRDGSAPFASRRWNHYPPGTNCHEFYGGIRGAFRLNNLFTKDYSAPANPFEPVIGKTTGPYAYGANQFIDVWPDRGVGSIRQERTAVSAVLTGAQQGLAGVLFSPSCIAGDSYAIHAFVNRAPYERNLGWIEAKPVLEGKTGTMQVWRLMTISRSVRLPDFALGGINSVTISDGGSKYSASDVGKPVTFSPPAAGTTATGTIGAVSGTGAVTAINITNRGSGYDGPATVTIPSAGGFSGLLGTRATGVANVRTSGVVSLRITNGGSGYDNRHKGWPVSFAAPGGSGARATGKIETVTGGAVTAISLTSQGSGYAVAPAVTIPPPTKQAVANVTITNNRVAAVPITEKGYGYEPAQLNVAVTFSPPQNPGVQATGVLAGFNDRGVAIITITNPGSGYTAATVTIPAPAMAVVTATATANLSATVGGGIGCPPDDSTIFRAHIGDGLGMSLSDLNARLAPAFNEWTIPLGPGVPAHDVHKNANLGAYRAAYNGLPLGPGKVPMPGDEDVKNEFVPFDHYRVKLPPGITYVNAARNAVAALPPGTPSSVAMSAVDSAVSGILMMDDSLKTGNPAIPVSPLPANGYRDWILGQIRTYRGTLLDALTPQVANQPKTMQTVRWPRIHDSPLWNNGGDTMGTAGMTILGTSLGDSQSIFITDVRDGTTFPHEMGHSCHLVHFVAGNFAWKHHNLLQPDCLMSYDYPTGFIAKPATSVGPVGGLAAADTGWPHTVPDPLPENHNLLSGTLTGANCIQLDAVPPHPTPDRHCAKCILKLRGWKEDLLPCAWNHPDLF